MKFKLLLLFYIFFEVNLLSQNLTNQQGIFYNIAPIYNFKNSIISLTFDDGEPNQFKVAVPLLNARNILATFYVPIYSLTDSTLKSMVTDAYLAHHEIGSHTVNHYNLVYLTRSQVEFELSQSQIIINNMLKSNECLTLAYPFGPFNDTVIQISNKYYLAARSVLIGYNSIDHFDRYFLKVKYYTHDTDLKLLNHLVESASEKGLWEIELFHGIDGQGFEPINSDMLKLHLDYIKSKESKMWFATVSNVIKYYDEFNNAQLVCDECNDNNYKLRLNDNLVDSVYNQPLSIKIRIPDAWEEPQVIGAEFMKTIFQGGNNFLLFNALPNNQLFTIKPGKVGAFKLQPSIRLLSIDPNPFSNNLNISFVITEPVVIQIVIRNFLGEIVMIEDSYCSNLINVIKISTNQYSKGFYILQLTNQSNHQSLVKKLLKI